jgi:hypothetical protein
LKLLDDIKSTNALGEENEALLKETLKSFLENFKKNN